MNAPAHPMAATAFNPPLPAVERARLMSRAWDLAREALSRLDFDAFDAAMDEFDAAKAGGGA